MKGSLKKLLLVFGLVILATTSCDNNTVSNSNSDVVETPSSDITSDNNSSSDDIVDEESYYQLPDWTEESYKCTIGLTDIGVHRSLVTGEKYNLAVSMKAPVPNPGNEQYISSNPKVFTISVDEEGQVIVNCLHAGMAMFRIIDGDGDVRYCETIRVADKIEVKDMEDHLVYNVDKWYSIFKGADEYIISFFPNNQYTIFGADQNGSTFEVVSGTYEYDSTSNNTTINEYYYVFTDENAKALELEGFFIDVTGEFMHLWAGSATANILYPDYRADEFKDIM